MKILNVRFKNLNSLVGEWQIDLTHPSYVADGFFAITGPTGSGKSTILDAICLALYGKTPRLDKVTQTSNEIMSRQTGECFAEVTFETQAGHFICHWSQHRSRRKHDADLQPPKHEISDAETSKILENKISAVASKIVDVTGMSYEQFTKSMLLAQGDFAIFLQAKPDERAPILEQITGTDIYSRISIFVHERCAEERRTKENLEATLEGLKPLTEEEETTLQADMAKNRERDLEIEQQANANSQAIAWLDRIAGIEKDLRQIEQDRIELTSKVEDFTPDGQRLKRALTALELAADYAELNSIRTAQKKDADDLAAFNSALPELEVAAKECEAALKQAQQDLDQAKDQQKNETVVIKSVRDLDTSLKGMEAPVASATKTVGDQKSAIGSIQSNVQENQNSLDRNQTAFKAANDYLSNNAADSGLAEHLSGIRSRFGLLKSEREKAVKSAGALSLAVEKATQASASHKTALSTKDSAENAVVTSLSAFEDAKSAALALLKKQEISFWRTLQSDLVRRLNSLANLYRLLDEKKSTSAAETEATNLETALTLKLVELTKNIEQQNSVVAACKREVELLTTQRELTLRVRNLEDDRSKLIDGAPCALCGSIDHPYAQGNIPSLDETELELGRAQTAYDEAAGKLNELKLDEGKARVQLAQSQKDIKASHLKLIDTNKQIAEVASSMESDPSAFEAKGFVDGLKIEASASLQEATEVIKAYEAQEKVIESARTDHEKSNKLLAEAEKKLQGATSDLDAANRETKRLTEETQQLNVNVDDLRNAAIRDIKAYGIVEIADAMLDSVLESLSKRRDLWGQNEDAKRRSEGEISTLDAQLKLHSEVLSTAQAELIERQKKLDLLVDEQRKLAKQRSELYGDKDPDQEEARLSLLIETTEGNVTKAREAAYNAKQKVLDIKSRIESCKKAIVERSASLEQGEAAFGKRISASGFIDETDFLTASLPENERASLLKTAQALADKQIELDTNEKDRTTRLTKERERSLTEQSREVLGEEANVLATAKKELAEQIGAAKQKLFDNEDLRNKKSAQIEAIEKQTTELTRWQNLTSLIGSSDGKKYRNFAQGVTFEIMIRHANRQLRKMTDRYLLVKNKNQPLELNVIDSYQAGEIRSSKNLSGGESFIVSLSLALGLSQMASRNVRVDSLFLDEGFGTLDEDALDMALDTLAGLQQDGKLIGVISHVSALKDRITTQIQVTPQSGGRSTISGPGCKECLS
jgi:exonuclease SbcC